MKSVSLWSGAALMVVLASAARAERPDCANTSTVVMFGDEGRDFVALPDSGAESLYCRDGHCEIGGLYPGGWTIRPPQIEAQALALGERIQPLDALGNPDPDGAVVMISVGMSNTAIAFEGKKNGQWTAFRPRAEADPAKNPRLAIFNGSIGGCAANDWVEGCDNVRAGGNPWSKVVGSIKPPYTPAQVQVAWIKHALRNTGPFPHYAQSLQGYLEQIVRDLKSNFPNVKVAYLTSRSYAYMRHTKGEPDNYEGGFAIRWMIDKQQSGDPALKYDDPLDPTDDGDPDIVAPLILWGPYFWTNGVDLLEGGYPPRSDGLTWTCAGDLDGDGINDGDMFDNPHPEPTGAQKNADQIYAFFKTDPSTTPWYLAPTDTPPDVTITADTLSGLAPLTVNFHASASSTAAQGSIVEYVWSFGDGTMSYNPDGRANPDNDPNIPSFYNTPHPTKIFHVPGVYTAYLTVTDSWGNARTATISITVQGPASASDSGTLPARRPLEDEP